MKTVTIVVFVFAWVFVSQAQNSFWHSLNWPCDRNFYSVAIDTSRNLVYTTDYAGLFRSSDSGESWSNVSNPGLLSLAVDSSGNIFGVNDRGIFKSTDRGQGWMQVASFQGWFFLIYIDPQQRILAISAYGVYSSTDDGSTWGHSNQDIGRVVSLTSNPVTHHLFAASFSPWGIFRSTDNGATWDSTNTGLTTRRVNCLVASSNGWLFAGTDYGGIFRSTDDGASWSIVNSYVSGSRVVTIAINSQNGFIFANTFGSVARSTDGGNTWTYYDSKLPSIDYVKGIYVMPDHKLLATTSYDGNYISTDQGQTWKQADSGLANAVVSAILVTPTGATLVATENGDLFRAPGDGNAWTFGWIFGSTPVTHLILGKSGTIFAGTNGAGVFRSTDDGVSWRQTNNGLTTISINSIATDLSGGIYVGGYGVLFKSTDAGANWVRASQGITDTKVNSIICGADGTLYAGTSPAGIFRSTDGGSTWSQANNGLTNTNVTSLATTGDGGILAGTSGSGVYRSSDRADSWSQLGGILREDSVSLVAVNSVGKIFAVTTSRWIYYSDSSSHSTSVMTSHSVYYSTDNGATWSNVDSTETDVQVLAFDTSGYLLGGTNGKGVLKSNHSTLTDVALRLTEPSKFYLYQNYPNPFNASTTIVYRIPTGGFVALKVYDVLGREVRRLVTERQGTGEHSVVFDATGLPSGVYFYRLTAPGVNEIKKMLMDK